MEIFKWVLVVLLGLEGLATIAMIGEYRKPISSTQACASVIINGVFIGLLLSL